MLTIHLLDTKTTLMPPGQATKRRSTTSMSEANLVELPAASPVDAFASLSPVDASPSSQTVDIGKCYYMLTLF